MTRKAATTVNAGVAGATAGIPAQAAPRDAERRFLMAGLAAVTAAAYAGAPTTPFRWPAGTVVTFTPGTDPTATLTAVASPTATLTEA